MRPALVYDIETEDWDRFVLGTVYDGQTPTVYRWPEGEEQLIRRINATEGEVWAHNGGRFDHLWYLDAGRRLGLVHNARVTLSGLGIVSIKVGNTVLLDSFRVFPMTLDQLSAGAKHSLADLCQCGKPGCGGYCAIRRDMPPSIRARVEEYAIADVVELWKALDHFSQFAASIRLDIGWTVAGTAWRSARAELHLPSTPHRTTARWAAVRRAYYGGRDEIFRVTSDHGERYDVNAMYPAALATTPIPVGDPRTLWWSGARDAWNAGSPGVYTARLTVPETHAPPLPTRARSGRLIFPVGEFVGTWARPELEHAIACGVRVREWIDAIVWDRAEILFKPWVERLFAIRMKHGKKTREGAWIKWIVNSLTGRLGTRCEVSAVVIDPDTVRGHRPECNGGLTCSGVCGCHRMISAPGTIPVYTSTALRVQSYAHPAWAAYLTAASRVKLHRRLTPAVAYCATDSCYSEQTMIRDVGSALGEWMHEGPYQEFEAIAPKVYRYHDGQKWVVRAKGIPVDETTWEKIVNHEAIHYLSRASIRRPAKDGSFFQKVPASRLVTPNTGARIPIPGTVLTRAPRYQEVAEL